MIATSWPGAVVAQFWGALNVPPQTFADHLQSRMADPSRTDLLSFAFIWYQPLSKEIADTWAWLCAENDPVPPPGWPAPGLDPAKEAAVLRARTGRPS